MSKRLILKLKRMNEHFYKILQINFISRGKNHYLYFLKQFFRSAFMKRGSGYHITECPKIYRKSVLHLLKYKFAAYLSRCCTDLKKKSLNLRDI